MAIAPKRPEIYEGTRIPSPIPSVLEVREDLRTSEDVLTVNFGPNHPSTHGVLRLVVDLHGEEVVGLAAVVGYLHTGFEKSMEQKSWWKAITYAPRIDYVSFQNNELVFVLAVEKLLDIEVPARATWMRMLLAELNRIHSHLVWLGTAALELGAISMFWYCFRERDRILDLFELVAGFRMHTRYFQVGGLAEDVPPGFWDECAKFVEVMPKAIDDYESLIDRSEIWLERTQGIGLLSAEDAIALGQSGPVLRGSGVDWDLRRAQPYLAYDQVDFRVPVYSEGRRLRALPRANGRDARVSEDRRAGYAANARRAVDRRRPQGRVAAAGGAPHVDGVPHPPLQDRHRGLPRPGGRGVRPDRIAARRARVLRRVGRRPEAVARQVSRPVVRSARGDGDVHAECARRRHDRDRRLSGHRHGRGRPMSAFYDEVQEIKAQYPNWRSATLPALRLAQEQHGYLSPEALRECADALGTTPAFCEAVASFYDMLHLETDRAAHGGGVHERVLRARRRTAGARDASSRSSASAPARRPRTARSR